MADYNIAIVTDEAELRNAVENDNGINYVYLANNITTQSGISIHPNKTELILDGEYPPLSGNRAVFTDTDSILPIYTIGIRATSNISITVKNMIIHGNSYFGMPYVSNELGVDTSGVTLLYDNIDYIGPQATYHRLGRTRYKDSNIEIVQTGNTEAQEVCQGNHIELEGEVNIHHRSTVRHAVFWFYNAATTSTFTVLEEANVNIVSDTNYFMYNMEVLTRVPVTYTLRRGSTLNLQVALGMTDNDLHSLDSFLVEEDASFHYIQTGSNSLYASLYMRGDLTVREGAKFFMRADSALNPLIYFPTGLFARSIRLENPRSFVLYSPSVSVMNIRADTDFFISSGQINIWTTATTPFEDAGGFEDMTSLRWFKKDFNSLLECSGIYYQSSTSITTNLDTQDEPYPNVNDIRFSLGHAVSVGDWQILPNPAFDDGGPITGWTEPNANMRLEYSIDSDDYSIDSTADENGYFSIETSGEIPPEIPSGTELTLKSNTPFLVKYTRYTVLDDGVFYIDDAPTQIVFRGSHVSLNPLLLARPLPEIPIVVKDLRPIELASQWELTAAVTEPLQSADGHILPDALVYVAEAGGEPIVLNGTPTAVYTGGPNVETTNATWAAAEGILVRVSVPVHLWVDYSTNIYWGLRSI